MTNINRLIDHTELSAEEISYISGKLLMSEVSSVISEVGSNKGPRHIYMTNTKINIIILSQIKQTLKRKNLYLRENITKSRTFAPLSEGSIKALCAEIFLKRKYPKYQANWANLVYKENIKMKKLTTMEITVKNEYEELRLLDSKTLFDMAISKESWDNFLRLRQTLEHKHD